MNDVGRDKNNNEDRVKKNNKGVKIKNINEVKNKRS